MFISKKIKPKDNALSGRGIFAKNDIRKGTVIEKSPVVVLNPEDRELINETPLYDYAFEWGKKGNMYCMALGYIALYNHDYHANCRYYMDFKKKIMTIETVRDIEKGEELFVNYNGEPNDPEPVWFHQDSNCVNWQAEVCKYPCPGCEKIVDV